MQDRVRKIKLSEENRAMLHNELSKYEFHFYITQGICKSEHVDI